MPFSGEGLGQVQPKVEITLLEKTMLVISILSLLTMFFIYGAIHDLLVNQQNGIQRAYLSRAITCDTAKGIGITEPAHCDDPEIQKYRDPKMVAGSSASARASKKTLQVMCQLVLSVNSPANIKKICLENG